MFPIPDALLHGPFTRRQALAVGLPERVLEGARFCRLHKAVYAHHDHEMTWEDHVAAAQLALPPGARTTGVTRLRQAGLAVGPPAPLHFVVEGDLHLELDGVFLHRTVKMPPHDDDGVSVEAAFVAVCAEARLIEAIAVGCVLLRRRQMDLTLLQQILDEERWRRGVPEATYVVPFLDPRPRSIPEAELLAHLVFAGLPIPEVNAPVEIAPGIVLTPDLWYRIYRLAVEYEGAQHQEDRAQYLADVDRYRLFRRNDVPYELITKERMRSPRSVVRLVHGALVERGYDGPEPDFEGLWQSLHVKVAEVVRAHRAA